MWRLAVGEESCVNDPNTRTAEVLGRVLNLEPRTEQVVVRVNIRVRARVKVRVTVECNYINRGVHNVGN